jgi:intracellular sulfur oxidation DsrE/DsrF family protein
MYIYVYISNIHICISIYAIYTFFSFTLMAHRCLHAAADAWCANSPRRLNLHNRHLSDCCMVSPSGFAIFAVHLQAGLAWMLR